MDLSALQLEAKNFGKYILGKEIDAETIDFYANSFKVSPIEGTEKEERLVSACNMSPWKIAFYDAALSLKDPEHLLKRKLLLMFAILETRTEYADSFLGREFSKFYLIKIGLVGARGVFRAVVGFIILPKL